MTLARLSLLLAAGGALSWWLGDSGAVRHGPGVVAPTTPTQTPVKGVAPFRYGDYAIQPLARFALQARVLGREDYRFDREAGLAPVDLALGWGPMSDERVLDQLSITQGGRWYRWSAQQLPVSRSEIQHNSANMHMIPADETVAEALDAVRDGQVVELRGYLIEARAADGWRWRSSLSRTDSGAHSCEVVYVEDLVIVGPG